MFSEQSPAPTALLIFAAFVIAISWLYGKAYPKPISGIPYHEPSAAKIFGDMPEMMQWLSKTQNFNGFLEKRCVQLNSAIIQIFTLPFKKPWVIICDAQETVDIMTRRAQEFDRSDFIINLFKEIVPHNHFTMKTGPEWRSNRRLVAECMSPGFVKTVGRIHVYSAALDLIRLWREKIRLAGDCPFDAHDDVHNCVLDAIWTAAFGTPIGVTSLHAQHLSQLDNVQLPTDKSAPVPFLLSPVSHDFESLKAFLESVAIPLNTPIFPRLIHRLALILSPKLSRAVRAKNALINNRLDDAWTKFSRPTSSDEDVQCAADMIVHREIQRAEKEKRPPQHKIPSVRDELFGFLIAGHGSSATTLGWGFKCLTAHPKVQARLLSALQVSFSRALKVDGNPTAEEIIDGNIPYLDACIEEILRFGSTVPAINRNATANTEILGHKIPKGTEVFMLLTGPGYKMSPFHIDHKKRSVSSQQTSEAVWNETDIEQFNPERWLVKDEGGNVKFNPKAGPTNPFGGGPRGCFGKNLAYMTMRMVCALVIWNFELKPTPAALSTFAAKSAAVYGPQQFYLRLGKRPSASV